MTYTRSQLLSFHPGRVLERPGYKVKVRVMLPRKIKKCDICCKAVNGLMIKTEKSGNITELIECIDCYIKHQGDK